LNLRALLQQVQGESWKVVEGTNRLVKA